MSVKKNDTFLALMTLVLVGTTVSTAYFAISNSRNVKAKEIAETAKEDFESKLASTDQSVLQKRDENLKLRTDLDLQRGDLNDLRKKHQLLTEMYEAAKSQVAPNAAGLQQQLDIANRNLDDLKRRNRANEDFLAQVFSELNVASADEALASLSALRGGIVETGGAEDPAIQAMLAEGSIKPVARAPQGFEARKPVGQQLGADESEIERLGTRIEYLAARLKQAEEIMEAQSNLITRLTSSEHSATGSTRIETLKPEMDTNPTAAVVPGPIVNESFRSISKVETGNEIVQQDDYAVPIATADSDAGLPANATLIETYFEDAGESTKE